jgi:hypothetical protein
VSTPTPSVTVSIFIDTTDPEVFSAQLIALAKFLKSVAQVQLTQVQGAVLSRNGTPVPTYLLQPPTPGRKEFVTFMPGQLVDTGGTSTVTVGLVDADDNPTTPDATPSWTDSAGLLTLSPNADNVSCDVTPIGPLGDGTLTYEVVDNDGTTVTVVDTYTVGPGEATAGSMAWGAQTPASS